MSKILLRCFPFLLLIAALISTAMQPGSRVKQARVKIVFRNTANGLAIQPDSIYKNAFGESYSVSKLKYYVSNFMIGNSGETESVHLINTFADSSFEFSLPEGLYKNIHFLLGVDSILNCSGAQTGALDPLNDMFWTWNSGYVMFKLEGTSPESSADLNRLEFHVGGYKGLYKTQREIGLSMPELRLTEAGGKLHEIVVEMKLDNFWNGKEQIHIKDKPFNPPRGICKSCSR